MIIYVSHSRVFDYRKELYDPLRSASIANLHTLILPHEKDEKPFDSRTLMSKKRCDMVIAEVSYRSIGVGIEIGWATAYGIPVVCVYKAGGTPSQSLRNACTAVIEYADAEELVSKVGKFIQSYGPKS